MPDRVASCPPEPAGIAELQGRPPHITTIVRQIVGWCCVLAGLIGLVVPGPGIALIFIGVALLGRRHPILRRVLAGLWRKCRRWAHTGDARRWLGVYGLRLARRLRLAKPADQDC